MLMPLLLTAQAQSRITVLGIEGPVLSNVLSRLKTLAESGMLVNLNDEELKGQIGTALTPFGYFNANIIIQNRQPQNLDVRIIKGAPVQIRQIQVSLSGEGKSNPNLQKAVHDLKLKSGDIFNSKDYEAAKQDLINAAEHQGYLRASFTKSQVLIDKNTHFANIELQMDTGMQYYFGQVRFDPTYICPCLLHRFVPFKPGQAYSTDQILALNNALSGSGYFKSVNIKPNLNTTDTSIPIDVSLQPIPRRSYSLGLGFGTDTGIRGRAGYHFIPVNRYGHKFNAVAIGSLKENSLQAQYTIPGSNPVTDQTDILGNASTLDYNSGYSNSLLVAVDQRHNVDSFQRTLSLNGLYERFNYENEPKEEKLTLFPKATLSWFYRPNELFSPSGYRFSLTGLAANKAVLSEISFSQISANFKVAKTFPSIRSRLYFHAMQAYTQINDINQLPLSLAMLLGGSDNMKAYSYNSIGPGKIMSYAGLEWQKETWHNWYFLTFADTGDVYNPGERAWKNDVGLGLMWVSPVGPIKIGVAQTVNNRFNSFDNNGTRLVISMGPDI